MIQKLTNFMISWDYPTISWDIMQTSKKNNIEQSQMTLVTLSEFGS